MSPERPLHTTTGEARGRSGRRRLAGAVVLVVAALATSACGTMASNARAADFCTHYDQLVKQAQEFRQQEVDTSNVDELRAEVQRVQDQLAAVVAESDGRLSTGYSQLQVALDDFRQSVIAAKEARSQTKKMIADSFAEVSKNWAEFQATVEAQCT